MLKNAISYITRKKLKTLIIFLVILVMATISLISVSIKDATKKASKETFKNITNSFSMQINRRVNPGNPRGGGNLKGEDIKKIASSKNIDSHIKRLLSSGDLVNSKRFETEESNRAYDPEKAEKFKNLVVVTGVNDSTKEDKFVAETFKLIKGRPIKSDDKGKVLVHKNLAELNNWKIGDKIKMKSNIYDANNEKQAKETVDLEIVGIFDGQSRQGASHPQELYENHIITDIHSAAKLYGQTEDTSIYDDATFFVKGDKNIDDVIKEAEKLDIDWNAYNLIKSANNYPQLQASISGVYKIADTLLILTLVFAGALLTLLLFLWINARKKEIGIMMALGVTKTKIIAQFIIELLSIGVFSFIGSYFFANYTAKTIGSQVLNSVTSNLAKKAAQEAASANLAGGPEVDGFHKTLTSLNIDISSENMIYVVIFCIAVILIALMIASIKMLRKHPKELLTDIE